MPGLVLQARCRDKAGGETRVGFTASRKVGGAVERNRARRRLKAAAGQIIPGHVKAGFDLVLIARGATAKRPFRALLEDLKAALKRLDVWRGDDAGDAGSPPPDAGTKKVI